MRIFRSPIAATLAAALLLLTPTVARSDEAAVPLATFESMIDGAPGLRAANAKVVSTQKAEGVATAKSGLEYTFETGLGPRSEIVLDNVNYNTLRYAQRAGVALPILGTADQQKNAVGQARTDESLARIELAFNRRTRISNLRDAYVLYWQYDGQQKIAQHYVDQTTAQIGAAHALRRNGFWTEANELDFQDALTRFQTDVRTLRSSRRAELAQIASALGTDVSSFRPLEPTFGARCTPRRDDVIRSASSVDATLAQIDAETDRLTAQAKLVKGSSIDAHATATLGNNFDFIPPRIGYDLEAGVTAQMSTHGRSEERSLRDEIAAQLDEQKLLAEQRRVEITAAAEAAIDELANARDDLAQLTRNETAKRETLREAYVRFRTLGGTGAGPFDEIQTDLADLFSAENTTAIARGTVFLKANALLLLAPDACT